MTCFYPRSSVFWWSCWTYRPHSTWFIIQHFCTNYHIDTGSKGKAHTWIESYLTVYYHQRREVWDMWCATGLVNGPQFLPLASIFRKYNINFHIYADNTQAHVSFSPDDEGITPERLEACLLEVKTWMAGNWLQLSDNNTESIVFGLKQNLLGCLLWADASSDTSMAVKSIGWDIKYLPCIS